MTKTSTGNSGHAIVVGSSLAGMLAARVLSDHFERVTIVERDGLDVAGDHRKGVPQSRHLHIMLVRGQRIIDSLFPDLEAAYDAAGVPLLNIARDIKTVVFGAELPNYPSQYQIRSSSRVWLESALRERLVKRAGITLRQHSECIGLDSTADGVSGIHVRRADGVRETLQADLVIDASGRNSKAPEWLSALGYATPAITTINAHLGYGSRWYRRSADAAAGWHGLLTGSEPTSNPRAGALLPVEGDRWILTLAGTAHQHPPTDEAGFLDFTRQMVTPTIYDVVKSLPPISPVYGYRRTENRWVHFERLKRWPDHFIVLGDAACCFNPVYGQGMAVSAIEANLLDGLLRQQRGNLRGLAPRFQRSLPAALKGAWLLSTGEDFRWPSTEGGRPDAATRVAHWYVDRVIKVMPQDASIIETFLSVQHLVEPPSALFRPSVVARVLKHTARSLRKRQAEPAAEVPSPSVR